MKDSTQLVEQAEKKKGKPDTGRCFDCGYLVIETEHIGCLRKTLKAVNEHENRNFQINEKQEPLTKNEISKLPVFSNETLTLLDFVRIIEAAHGIKGEV